MKVKILHILCYLFVIFLSPSFLFVELYSASSSQSEDAFILLDNYIVNYTKRFNTTYRLYRTDISPEALSINKKLGGIRESLRNTYASNLSSTQKQKIIKNQIHILEGLHSEAKKYLEQEQKSYFKKLQKSQIVYSQLVKKITRQVDSFIQALSHSLRQKKSLSDRDKKAVLVLIYIREQNQKLKSFSSESFDSHQEMKSFIKQHVNAIRIGFKKLKDLY